MRNLLRNIILSSVGNLKSIGNGVHILNSHYISKDNNISDDVFYQLLSKIKQQADFINIEDGLKIIKEKQVVNQKLVAFTFDDGFEECYTNIAPALDQFNTNAAFFINPGFVDGNAEYIKEFQDKKVHVDKKPMSWNQIKELHQQGFIIGNHTLDHLKLINLSEQELENQIVKSQQRIEENIGANCDYFAWTYGSLNDISQNALNLALKHHKYVFSCDNYTQYFSNNNPNIINRRHIEGNWPISHVKYFLSKGKSY